MANGDLLASARKLAAALKELGGLESGLSKAHLSGNRATDVVFEVYVDLCVLLEIRDAGWTIAVQNQPGGNNALRIPMKPGAKANFPYFKASRNGSVFQVCFGTNLACKTGDTYAPDISFQHGAASLTPTFMDLEFCFDQKYSEKAKLSRDVVVAFGGYVNTLCAKNAKTKLAPFKSKSVFVNRHSIVTNTKQCSLASAALVSFGITEISVFYPQSVAPVRRP